MPDARLGPVALEDARVLVSNDDGIHAPGIKVLEKALESLVREVVVVAPETEQSATSHSLTLRRPLRIRELSDGRYAVDGTPTDAVLLGVTEVMKDDPPDLILSGVNRGGNLGEDVTYSGTVAAAMEGCLLGYPAVALSQVADDRNNVKWKTAERWIPKVLKKLAETDWPSGVLINVNFPDVTAAKVTGVELVRQGKRKIGGGMQQGIDPRGEPYYWIGVQRDEQRFRRGTDLECVGRGGVSVTPLSLDLTHGATLRRIKKTFA